MHASAADVLSLLASGALVCDEGTFDLRAPLRAARDGTVLYTPEVLAERVARPPTPRHAATAMATTAEGTAECGRRLVLAGHARVAVLNFASARRPGGGFLGGARAQEEDLCRSSGLYPCLERQRAYYDANRAHPDALYTDHIIYSPDVPFFRDGKRWVRPWPLSVITAPAPNTAAVLNAHPGARGAIAETFRRRAAYVLAVAEDRGHETLVLGAWGCGAFGGDPTQAADAFSEALAGRFAGAFARVVFAVLGTNPRDAENRATFERRFGAG